MSYFSTKKYGHEVGLSCAFRQWRANDSHCHLIHGYALAFKFVFGAVTLDERNWVVDFGGLKELKDALCGAFDHKLIVALDDPKIDELTMLHHIGVADVLVLPNVGVEMFAKHAFEIAERVVRKKFGARVWVELCEVSEHGANSAIYRPGLGSRATIHSMGGQSDHD